MKKIIRKDVKLKDKSNKLCNITRATQIDNEDTFNDSSKYITEFPNDSPLKEFPEYLAGYTPLATNTGLMCFYRNLTTNTDGELIAGELIIYDLLANDTTEISSINPDIMPILDYNHITNPLNVRHLNFSNGNFKPEREYYNEYQKRFILIDCDRIEGAENIDVDNGYFQYDSVTKTNPMSVEFDYKPVFVLRVFSNDGTIYTDDIDNFISMEKTKVREDSTEEKIKTGVYYRDCSTIKDEYISISAPSSGSGYMEVL